MEDMAANAPSQVVAPDPIITRAMDRLVGNVSALHGQVKALEEKLIPVMSDVPLVDEEGQKGEGHMGVPIAVTLHGMSVDLEDYYKRLDSLLKRIEV